MTRNPYTHPAPPEPPTPACTLGTAALFDPPTSSSPAETLRLHTAAAHCRRCPLTAECITAAKANRDSGVRGGLLFDDGQARRLPRSAA